MDMMMRVSAISPGRLVVSRRECSSFLARPPLSTYCAANSPPGSMTRRDNRTTARSTVDLLRRGSTWTSLGTAPSCCSAPSSFVRSRPCISPAAEEAMPASEGAAASIGMSSTRATSVTVRLTPSPPPPNSSGHFSNLLMASSWMTLTSADTSSEFTIKAARRFPSRSPSRRPPAPSSSPTPSHSTACITSCRALCRPAGDKSEADDSVWRRRQHRAHRPEDSIAPARKSLPCTRTSWCSSDITPSRHPVRANPKLLPSALPNV
mmetsp:Transcript_6041/g.14371  ORF Transcript_6041/g.14371 Transcript_6041/m.14371 type:complete len:264 (-) Transcript_6041:354-1145(-)